VAVGLIWFSAQAAAAIVYVDATDGASGNTAVAPSAGGGVFNPSGAVGSQGPGGDGLWDLRAFGNNATIYQNASSGNIDNAQRLATSVSGLPAGMYNVYAYFWSDTSNWRLGAALADGPGNLPLYTFQPLSPGVVQYYTGADATVLSSSLSPNPFTTGVMIGEGNRRLLQIPLGTVTGSGFTVYADDDPMQADSNQRTWYDGVGYERVPEPATAMLFALALGAWARCRNRRASKPRE
jgi:hypothetical protein